MITSTHQSLSLISLAWPTMRETFDRSIVNGLISRCVNGYRPVDRIYHTTALLIVRLSTEQTAPPSTMHFVRRPVERRQRCFLAKRTLSEIQCPVQNGSFFDASLHLNYKRKCKEREALDSRSRFANKATIAREEREGKGIVSTRILRFRNRRFPQFAFSRVANPPAKKMSFPDCCVSPDHPFCFPLSPSIVPKVGARCTCTCAHDISPTFPRQISGKSCAGVSKEPTFPLNG